MNKRDHNKSRRDFLKKVGYAAPVILTMKAAPAFAKSGSGITRCHNGISQERGIFDHPPRGLAQKFDKDFNKHGVFAPFGENRASERARFGSFIQSHISRLLSYFR